MKTLKFNNPAKNLFLGIFTIMIVLSFESCFKKVDFLNSAVVPAARGYVKVKRDNNKNYIINIHILDLAEVKRLQPPKQSYVVWMVTEEGTTKNIGRLNSSTALFSSKLKASFKTVSSLKPSQILITAEENPNTQNPDPQIVLSTDRF